MAAQQTIELGIDPVNAVKGGLQQGTYVCKELVRAFDAMVTGAAQPPAELPYDL